MQKPMQKQTQKHMQKKVHPEQTNHQAGGTPGIIPQPARRGRSRNKYRCCIELNQNCKYCVRIRVRFTRHAWVLPVYFLASTFDRALQKLEQTLQFLQSQEDRLWFWGVDRSDDPNVSAEMLREAGLGLDRRLDFPRDTESVAVAPEQPLPALLLAPLRRSFAESARSEAGVRSPGAVRAATAGD
jgi:hypothetical protein